ncbi:hypothetical protein [Paraliomyxa miuraensis]|uniref:hypothetical protein n=1 Tax=Paraliomyxa miuraensis TaxID=376150 RepID=UPI00225694B6|nr:hypothetical protein [Paraliomyxa miuraensis]MCX4247253.1 hypothetical protein [Paraliomyxa miuraensis]
MTAARSLLLLGLVALGSIACGTKDETPPSDTKEQTPPTQVVVPPVAAGSTGDAGTGGSTAADPFATAGWEDDEDDGAATVGSEPDTDGTGTGEAAAPATAFAGPCYVRWSGGPVLRFKYEADGSGGLLRIDGDNDGKSDVCARFWTKDERTHKVTVDEGCNKSTEAIITPSYDDTANVATATYTDQRDGKDAKHEITLITLPAFTGIAPGYPLYAERDDVKLDVKDGRVTKATVSKPVEGPAVKVTLAYDDAGRATRIDEDHEADGKVDRRYDYRYDEVGNVTGITLTETTVVDGKSKKNKKTAKLGYSCWEQK